MVKHIALLICVYNMCVCMVQSRNEISFLLIRVLLLLLFIHLPLSRLNKRIDAPRISTYTTYISKLLCIEVGSSRFSLVLASFPWNDDWIKAKSVAWQIKQYQMNGNSNSNSNINNNTNTRNESKKWNHIIKFQRWGLFHHKFGHIYHKITCTNTHINTFCVRLCATVGSVAITSSHHPMLVHTFTSSRKHNKAMNKALNAIMKFKIDGA